MRNIMYEDHGSNTLDINKGIVIISMLKISYANVYTMFQIYTNNLHLWYNRS